MGFSKDVLGQIDSLELASTAGVNDLRLIGQLMQAQAALRGVQEVTHSAKKSQEFFLLPVVFSMQQTRGGTVFPGGYGRASFELEKPAKIVSKRLWSARALDGGGQRLSFTG